MESHSKTTKPESIDSLVFLTLISVGFLLFGLVIVACGFTLNYHDDFKASDDGETLKLFVESQFDYTQYWLGLPFLITGALSMASSMCQKNRSLVTVTFLCLSTCLILSLFAMILEGIDWNTWNNRDRFRKALEEDDYSCSTQSQSQFHPSHSCVCQHPEQGSWTVLSFATCSTITRLSGLFGTIAASAVFGMFLSLAGIVIILKSLQGNLVISSLEMIWTG
ncbi:uncharacterized protein LOC114530589 [Dendronephthya gigantea]|uniref:uncharacterized protein LOC114530589 n=1 Tax=Dendronephthya gigantea TaxID=151771 RepID=UPI0010693984|nr:uncharacterized protein LOC114530589 [Dendronephthya gigantea]XP_028407973.1 uncharacterized protein LOC114530589 [Dendronephthya gigantea]